MQNGNNAKATSPLKDEYPEILKVSSQAVAAMRAACGESANATPRLVATPLPPLNLRNIEKLCPRMAANPMTPSNATRVSVICKGIDTNCPENWIPVFG